MREWRWGGRTTQALLRLAGKGYSSALISRVDRKRGMMTKGWWSSTAGLARWLAVMQEVNKVDAGLCSYVWTTTWMMTGHSNQPWFSQLSRFGKQVCKRVASR
jgi:hypothetical protein